MKAYNVEFIPHKRTSLHIPIIPPCIVYATNKNGAKECAEGIARDCNSGNEYMVRQYKYIIKAE